jgi:hypothetical protein
MRSSSIYALFLEPETEVYRSAKPLFERALDWAIVAFQAKPTLCHVEIVMAIEDGPTHFSTYIGQRASFRASDEYYTHETAGRWRAVPVCLADEDLFLRQCRSTCNAPYSLFRYVTALRPFRWLGRLLPNNAQSPAQCANLVARVIQMTDKNYLTNHPNTYAPVNLYYELSSRFRNSDRADLEHNKSLDTLHTEYTQAEDRIDGSIRVRAAEHALAAQLLSAGRVHSKD